MIQEHGSVCLHDIQLSYSLFNFLVHSGIVEATLDFVPKAVILLSEN